MRVNLTKKEIINSIYMQLGFSKKICENLIEDFRNYTKATDYNNKVKIPKFGTFILRYKKRIGRNPKTLEKIISERNVILFKTSKLKNI